MKPEYVACLKEAMKVMASGVQTLLDNGLPARSRADGALIAFHGMLVMAVQNDELDLEYIADLRERMKLVTDALDMVEAALSEKH